MNNNSEIQYTDAAIDKLEQLKYNYVESIEKILYLKKKIPGEQYIEVTASDLEQISNYIKLIEPNKYNFSKQVSIFYTMLGFCVTIIGLFYPFFLSLVEQSPERIAIILGGFLTATAGLWLHFRIKRKESLSREETQNYISLSTEAIYNFKKNKTTTD